MKNQDLKIKLHNLPHAPGSYQMKDKNGDIIYVGKAKDLHNRVNSYFVGEHDFKTTKLVKAINDFDFIVTSSEKEALVLEINLIKQYRPKYNIQFIDDSSYPYIKLTKEKYPRLSISRDIKKDKNAYYFGPYPDVKAVRNLINLLQKIYPFRKCNRMHDKLCLYYHINECLGPCEIDIDEEVYQTMSKDIRKFLNGSSKDLENKLYEEMNKASEALDFEKALIYKNLLTSINAVVQDKQNVESSQNKDSDYFSYYVKNGYISIAGFLIRNGIIMEKEFRLSPLYGNAEEEFENFIIQYYEKNLKVKELVLPNEIDYEFLAELLEMNITSAQRGHKRKMIEMCTNNAEKQLNLKFDTVEKQSNAITNAVKELSDIANHKMDRIELFDNSHTSGSFTVSSLVVYQDGYPERNSYRLYKLHTKNNDIKSMKEVTYRRYYRLLTEEAKLPDAILVDGGLIQINAVKEILNSLGLDKTIKIMGLVKDRNHNTDGLMDDSGNVIKIDKKSELFFLLTRMQDEVHRRAIEYHRKLRSKAQTKSILDEIEGVGPTRKKELLKTFKSLTNLKKATIEELSECVPEQVAINIYNTLHE